jgi:hypothetical protein
MASTVGKSRLGGPLCTEEMKRLALQEVLQSNTFERSDLLKRFLRYVCEMEIAGRLDEINEYTIGIEALGRPASYSPAGDSSVRSRAHAVREKLAIFYETEGTDAPFRIELRKGSYIPHFVPRTEVQPPIEPVPVTAPVPAEPPATVSPRKVLTVGRAFAAGILVGALLLVPLSLLRRPAAADDAVSPIVREVWGPLLQPGSDVVLCLATAPSMLLHSYREGTLPPTPRIFPVPDEVVKWYEGLHMQDGGGRLYSQTTSNTTLFGDGLASIAAVRMLTIARKGVQIVPEYSVHPLTLRGRDVIVVGSPNYSPVAARVLREAPFSVRYDPATRLEVVSTEDPKGEGGALYSSERGQSMGLKRAYGLITVLPGPGPNDDTRRIVLFSGISSAGTQAAVEYFCSPANLRSLKAKMHDASGNLPASYQVVVRCGVVNNLALDWAYETHRVIEKPPSIN